MGADNFRKSTVPVQTNLFCLKKVAFNSNYCKSPNICAHIMFIMFTYTYKPFVLPNILFLAKSVEYILYQH